jgi:hypothetical protein
MDRVLKDKILHKKIHKRFIFHGREIPVCFTVPVLKHPPYLTDSWSEVSCQHCRKSKPEEAK